jgi:PPM family protein phosphatase
MEVSSLVESAGSVGQDRLLVRPFRDGQLLVLADGAGGTSGGADAADAVIAFARTLDAPSETDWPSILKDMDRLIAGYTRPGETTAILAYLASDRPVGASVGDSEAWGVSEDQVTDLTGAQRRKPLLGSGRAIPVGFGPAPRTKRVLIASDGLFKYAPADTIRRLSLLPPHEAVRALIDAARMPNGKLQDDVAVIVAA